MKRTILTAVLLTAALALPVFSAGETRVVNRKGKNFDCYRVIVGSTTPKELISNSTTANTSAGYYQCTDIMIRNYAGYTIFIDSHSAVRTNADTTSDDQGSPVDVGDIIPIQGELWGFGGIWAKALTGNTTVYIYVTKE